MRKVVVSNFVSLDGMYAGPNGEIDWFTGISDKEFQAYMVQLIGSIDTMLFGRVTYEFMAGYWPSALFEADDPGITEAMNNFPKVVFSKTLTGVEWKNSRLAKGNPAEEISKLKSGPGKDMVIYGSGSIVPAFDSERLFVFIHKLIFLFRRFSYRFVR